MSSATSPVSGLKIKHAPNHQPTSIFSCVQIFQPLRWIRRCNLPQYWGALWLWPRLIVPLRFMSSWTCVAQARPGPLKSFWLLKKIEQILTVEHYIIEIQHVQTCLAKHWVQRRSEDNHMQNRSLCCWISRFYPSKSQKLWRRIHPMQPTWLAKGNGVWDKENVTPTMPHFATLRIIAIYERVIASLSSARSVNKQAIAVWMIQILVQSLLLFPADVKVAWYCRSVWFRVCSAKATESEPSKTAETALWKSLQKVSSGIGSGSRLKKTTCIRSPSVMHPRNSTLKSLKRFAGAVIQCSQDFATENQSNNAVLIFVSVLFRACCVLPWYFFVWFRHSWHCLGLTVQCTNIKVAWVWEWQSHGESGYQKYLLQISTAVNRILPDRKHHDCRWYRFPGTWTVAADWRQLSMLNDAVLC